jgi:H+/Cl- antiporter ClcA
LLGLPASMGAAIGFICVFCGITNCPIASFLLSIEVFGTSGSLYFLGAVAIAYAASGFASIYSRQKILYSKTSPVFRGK